VNRLNKTKVERKPDFKGITHPFARIDYAHIYSTWYLSFFKHNMIVLRL
jgi:hypothetical protein